MNDHHCRPPRIDDGQRWTCPTCRRVWIYKATAESLGQMAPRERQPGTRGVTR